MDALENKSQGRFQRTRQIESDTMNHSIMNEQGITEDFAIAKESKY